MILSNLNPLSITQQAFTHMTLDKEFYTPKELADMLQVDVMTIYRYVKRGAIPVYKVGRNQRFRREDIERFLQGLKETKQDAEDC